MLQAIPSNEEADPVQVGVFGAKAIVQIAGALADLGKQARGLRGGGWERGHGLAVCGYSIVHR
jgi:hypothetical protein